MRLFVAIQNPTMGSEALQVAVKKIRTQAGQREISMKVIPLENWHVTLVFLGELAQSEIPRIEGAMKGVAATSAPFTLKLKGLNAFSDPTHARVIWSAVNRTQALYDLQTKLAAALGVVEEGAEFIPHVSVARLKNPQSVRALLDPYKHKAFGVVEVREIVLFESQMQGYFPVYKPLFRCALTLKPDQL